MDFYHTVYCQLDNSQRNQDIETNWIHGRTFLNCPNFTQDYCGHKILQLTTIDHEIEALEMLSLKIMETIHQNSKNSKKFGYRLRWYFLLTYCKAL